MSQPVHEDVMASSAALCVYRAPAKPGAEREQLILDHLPQVRWIASRIHERLPDERLSGRSDLDRNRGIDQCHR